MGQHRRDATRGGRTVPLRLAQAGAAEPRPRRPPSSVSGPACRLLERPRGRLSRDCGDLEGRADPLGCCPEDDPTRLSEREPEAGPTTDGSACWGRSRGPRRRRRSPAPSSPGGRRPGADPQRLSPPRCPLERGLTPNSEGTFPDKVTPSPGTEGTWSGGVWLL